MSEEFEAVRREVLGWDEDGTKTVTIKDGYYSSKQSELYGYAIYKDIDGNEVAVTNVVAEGKKSPSNWDDEKFVAKIYEFVRAVEAPRRSLFDKESMKRELAEEQFDYGNYRMECASESFEEEQ